MISFRGQKKPGHAQIGLVILSMPLKVTIPVIKLVFLGINVSGPSQSLFNPHQATWPKMRLSQAQNTFIPMKIHSIVLLLLYKPLQHQHVCDMSYTYTDWLLQEILLQCNSWIDSAPVNCIQRESKEDLDSLPEMNKNHTFLTTNGFH